MILAAAIKFHIEKSGEDVVLCGARHGDIFKQVKQLGFEAKKGYKEIEQGFIDKGFKKDYYQANADNARRVRTF